MILEKEMQNRKIHRLLKSNDSLILKNKELIEENTILKQKISSLEKVISDIQESEQIYRDGIADIKELKEKYSQAIMSVNSMKKKYKKEMDDLVKNMKRQKYTVIFHNKLLEELLCMVMILFFVMKN